MARDETLLENASNPTVVDGAPGREGKKPPDMLARIINARQQIIEQDVIKDTIRDLNSAPAPAPAPATPAFTVTGNLDLGAVLTSAQKHSETLMDKQTAMTEAARAEATSSLRGELAEIKKALADPKQPTSAIEHYREVKALMDEMRGEAGLAADVRSSAGDLSLQIELRRLEEEGADRRQHWAEEAAERRRQHDWDIEKWKAERAEEHQRWETEMVERRGEATRSASVRQEAMGHVNDLIQAWTGSVDEKMAGSGVDRAGAPAKSFGCQQCQAAVPMVGPGEKVACPSCGAEYQMEAE